MNVHLYKKDFSRLKKPMIFWGLGILGLTLMATAIYLLYEKIDMNAIMGEMIKKIDPEAAKTMGMEEQLFSTILGTYYGTYSSYILLIFSIFAATVGANIIGKEFRFGTNEFLMTRPVTRKEVFMTKAMVVVSIVILVSIIQTGIAALFMVLFQSESEINWSNFFILHGQGFAVVFFFACIGVLLSIIKNPTKNKMGLMIGVIFGTFVLNLIVSPYEKIAWLSYISPFKNVAMEVNDPSLSLNYIGTIGLIAIGILALFLAKLKFEKMDLV